jgi:hypothetical protein
MSEVLVLLDWENSCQTFLKGFQQPKDFKSSFSRRLKVLLFVRKSNEELKETELPRYVQVRRAPTNTPDAADTILKQYVGTDLLRVCSCFSSSSKRDIFLVDGGDKGYATVAAQLRERFGERFHHVDGANTCLADLSDLKYATGGECDCHILFASEVERNSHFRPSSCPCCDAQFKCAGAPQHERWRCNRIVCRDILPERRCDFVRCEEQEDLKNAHLDKEHPQCTHQDCPCGNRRFPHPRLYAVHMRHLEASNAANRCHHFECLIIDYGEQWRVSPDVGSRKWFIKHTVLLHRDRCRRCPLCGDFLVDNRHCQSHFDRKHKDVTGKDRRKLRVFERCNC